MEHLTCTVERGVAVLEFRESSYSDANLEAVAGAIRSLDARDDVVAIVLRGSGSTFHSGASIALLDHMSTLDRDGAVRLVQRGQHNIRAMLRSPKLVACYVEGLAAGGGVDLVLGCDLVLVGPQARINLFYGKLGVVPDQGGLYLLAERLGWARALKAAERSDTWSADECVQLGIADRKVDAPAPLDFAKLLRRELRVPASTRAALKQLRWDASAPALERHLQQVAGQMVDLVRRDEQRALIERVRAMQRVQEAANP